MLPPTERKLVFAKKTLSIHRKAVEVPRAAGCDQVFLAAAACGMGRVPTDPSPGPVEMPYLGASLSRTGPVAASMVGAVGKCRPISLRSRKNVMLVGSASDPINGFSFFCQNGRAGNKITATRLLQGSSMEVSKVLRDACSLGVVPRSFTNSVSGH